MSFGSDPLLNVLSSAVNKSIDPQRKIEHIILHSFHHPLIQQSADYSCESLQRTNMRDELISGQKLSCRSLLISFLHVFSLFFFNSFLPSIGSFHSFISRLLNNLKDSRSAHPASNYQTIFFIINERPDARRLATSQLL